jgi:imidazolonepropionase-like amidohydrolase
MSGGGGNSTVTQKTDLPSWVTDAAGLNINRAQALSNTPFAPFTGPTLAPLTPDQTAAFNTVRSNLGSTAPLYSAAESSLVNFPQTVQSLLNPYLKDVEGATVSNMQRAGALAGESNAASAASSGAFGGTRYGVQKSILDSETERNIGQAVSQIEAGGWNTAANEALTRATGMANIAGAGQNALLQGAGALASAGSTEQAQTQAEYDQALQKWTEAQNYPLQELAIAQSALAGTPYGANVTAQQPYNTNPLASAVGTAASALPAAYLAGQGINAAGTSLGLWGAGAGLPVSAGAPAIASAIGSGVPVSLLSNAAFDTAGMGGLDAATLAAMGDITATGASAAATAAAATPIILSPLGI